MGVFFWGDRNSQDVNSAYLGLLFKCTNLVIPSDLTV